MKRRGNWNRIAVAGKGNLQVKIDSLVVIPTYNARKRVIKTVDGVLKYLPNSNIIVVDDTSPDKTYELIQKKYKGNKRVKLIIRSEKGGRGSAVIAGFLEGLKDKNIKYFYEMDADFSHDPKFLPEIKKEAENYDIVVGSRYMKGSKITGWNRKRRIFSRIANLWAKIILGIPISDYTNGYRCYRRKVLESIDLGTIKAKGYIVLSEIAFKAYKKGFKFKQVPIVFPCFENNVSNFNINEVKNAFLTVFMLRFYD